MNIHTVYGFFMRRFRPARVAALAHRFTLLQDPSAKILDVGGTTWPWCDLNPAGNVTILNIDPPSLTTTAQKWSFIQGDGTNLQYSDKEFDLVFSNSVIEHVGDWARQEQFAKELLRCGKSIYFQTPNKWFFIEPHLIAPFLHWLPTNVARRMVRYFSVWGYIVRPTQIEIDEFFKSTRLLTYKEVQTLFPDCTIERETFLGMTKSFVVTSHDFDGSLVQRNGQL